MDYRNVIFDFDGTLVDTAGLILETMRQTISALQLPERSEDECRATIGRRLEDIPAVLWPEIPCLAERYAATYRQTFDRLKHTFRVRLYPGVADTLAALSVRGVKMAIASSRNSSSLREISADLGIDGYFCQFVGGDNVKRGKPAPDPVNLILATQGWGADLTLVVGDMDVDVVMGQRAGCATCAVTYGNATAASLSATNPTLLITSFSRLLDVGVE